MARKKPVPPSPFGRRELFGDRKYESVLKRFGRKEFRRILDLVLTCNKAELLEVTMDPSRSALTQGIAEALYRAVEDGNWKVIESICERIVGTVTRRVDHTSKGGRIADPDAKPQKVVLYMPKNGRTKEENEVPDVGTDEVDRGF